MDRENVKSYKKILFILTCFFTLISVISNVLHFNNTWYGNNITWLGWIISVVLLVITFLPEKSVFNKYLLSYKSKYTILFSAIFVFFLITHLINWKTAPWNSYGLFDDGAWDIYFAKNKIFSGQPFQVAFFDNIGSIYRETAFHYYLIIFFKLFGYNLAVYNIALTLLSSVTLMFCAMLIQEMLKNIYITAFSALVLNFFPLYFMQTYAGHRYAMAAPLMLASFYFIYTAFCNKSLIRTVISGIITAICVQATPMGKHYFLALVISAVLYLIIGNKKVCTKTNLKLVLTFIFSFIVTAIPYLIFIIFTPDFLAHESDLTQSFLNVYKAEGYEGIKTNYIDRFIEVMFGEYSYNRWFTNDFITIPILYYPYILLGSVIAFVKKNYLPIVMAFLPVAGAFVSGTIDMRFLHSVPFWIILMSISFSFIFNLLKKLLSTKIHNKAAIILCIIVTFSLATVELVPCISYINKKASDNTSTYLLPQVDVAVSRVIRDIVAGDENPSDKMRKNELLKRTDLSEPDYNVLAVTKGAYAIAHLFLQDYDDEKILSFSNGHPSGVRMTQDELIYYNKSAVEQYSSDKDLKLIWENDDSTQNIISSFDNIEVEHKTQVISGQVGNASYSLTVMTVNKEDINAFKKAVKKINLYGVE